MAAFLAVTENYALTATLSGGSFETSLPRSNVISDDIRAVARTTNDANASTKLIFDLGAAKQVGAVVVYNGNWSLDSTYRVRASNDAGFSTVRYNSGWKNFPGFVVPWGLIPYGDPDFWTATLNNRLLSEYPRSMIEIIPEAQKYTGGLSRYWEIAYDDTSNADGYHDYGYAMIGPTWRASINYGENNAKSVISLSDVSESLSGKRAWQERGVRRKWSASFGWLDNDESFYTQLRLATKQRDSRPVFIVPDEDDVLHLQMRSFLASMKTLPEIQQLLMLADKNSTALSFEEWL